MSALSEDIRAGLDVRAALEAAGITQDDPDYADLMASECDVQDRLVRILRAARHTEAQSKALAEIVAENKDRKQRLDAKVARLREIVLRAMGDLGLKKIEAPDLSASVSQSRPKVIVTDETLLPDDVCVFKREPSKTAISEWLKERPCPGAELSNGGATLTLRSR